MSIKRVAQKRRKELIYALDNADGNFYPWAYGDLATVDRFLSNFNRPLQRRALHIDPTQDLPDSGVIRVESTQEIYLISEPRDDASDNKSYDRMCVLHHVSGHSSGYVEVFNYEEDINKPATTRAEYVKTSIGKVYLSLEYYSSKKSENSDEYYEGKFLVFSPMNTPLKKDGVFTLNGKQYKILQTYVDSSYSCALSLEQADDMESLTYYEIGTGSSYDVTTGSLTFNETQYKFSGSVDYDEVKEGGVVSLTVYVKAKNLPFSLCVGNYIADANGVRSKIVSISRDNNAGGQYKLRCER